MSKSIIAETVPKIKELLAQGKKKEALKLVKALAADPEVPFPRIQAVIDDYDADSNELLWGQWGPDDDFMIKATLSVEAAFVENASMLMTSKGLAAGRDAMAQQAGVQGALYDAGDDACALCRSLDGIQVKYGGAEYYQIAMPQHCFCECQWIYIGSEQEDFEPEENFDKEILKRINKHPDNKEKFDNLTQAFQKYGHANAFWFEKTKGKGDNEAEVTARTAVKEVQRQLGVISSKIEDHNLLPEEIEKIKEIGEKKDAK